jgi:hypothetical protein
MEHAQAYLGMLNVMSAYTKAFSLFGWSGLLLSYMKLMLYKQKVQNLHHSRIQTTSRCGSKFHGYRPQICSLQPHVMVHRKPPV